MSLTTNGTSQKSSNDSPDCIDSLFKTKNLLEPASEEQWKQLYHDLQIDPNQLQEDVRTLRKWLSLQPHLPQTATDTMLTSFLIGCKNSIQRTKQKLDAYYTVKTQMPELFENRDPLTQEARDAGRDVRMYLLPKLNPKGYRIISSSFKSPDTTYYDVKENLKRILSLIDVRIHSEGFYQGDFMILNAKYFSIGHAVRLTPTMMKDFLHCVQDVLPLRIKGIVFYNAPPLIEKTMNNVVKPFLKKKIRDRFFIYSEDHTILLKHFPREMLPKNLGGDDESDDTLNELWDRKLASWKEWFLKEGSARSDESKRVYEENCKPVNHFGMEGSFRKLTID